MSAARTGSPLPNTPARTQGACHESRLSAERAGRAAHINRVEPPQKRPAAMLSEAEVFKMSVTNALGCGQQRGYSQSYRGNIVEVNLFKDVRLEIGVNDDFVQTIIDAIIKGARSRSSRQARLAQVRHRASSVRRQRVRSERSVHPRSGSIDFRTSAWPSTSSSKRSARCEAPRGLPPSATPREPQDLGVAEAHRPDISAERSRRSSQPSRGEKRKTTSSANPCAGRWSERPLVLSSYLHLLAPLRLQDVGSEDAPISILPPEPSEWRTPRPSRRNRRLPRRQDTSEGF